MEFYKDLYVSGFLKNKKNKLIKDIKNKNARADIYIITLPLCDHNQLEYYSTLMLKQKIYDEKEIFVVGIADGYLDSMYLVKDIYKDIYEKTGSTDVRRYFEDKRLKGGA